MLSVSPSLLFLRLQARINLLIKKQVKPLRNLRHGLLQFFLVHTPILPEYFPSVHDKRPFYPSNARFLFSLLPAYRQSGSR